ncbi:MAG: RtcB family protein [Candidatus Latescibacteria bacterium]|nr:RtcB family protein [Candidatus Latescibacterota bacterium]
MAQNWKGPLEKIDDYRLKIPKSYKSSMRVDGIIYVDARLLDKIKEDQAPEQVANVATLPGILKASMAMPDIHWGYGFPIGGVAGFDLKTGVISPGGVGYDINCGVRLLRTNLYRKDITNEILEKLVRSLFHNVPSGVGSTGKIRISESEVKNVLIKGARWAYENGYGTEEDLEYIEEHGQMSGADPIKVTRRAVERGVQQLGTLGAGNHFLEIQEVEEIYDSQAANIFRLEKGQIAVMIHTGSRGLGYQICDDNVKDLGRAVQKYNIALPDRQLACAPIESAEGKAYFSAMVCAANYAWANRQCITHWVREAFAQVYNKTVDELGMELIYDVAHNIAKFEEHTVNGNKQTVCVHRKGATRAFPPGHPVLPEKYKPIGQPVIIPGDMGTNSYLLLGTQKAFEETFGSTCHGAGRVWSRTRALDQTRNRDIARELKSKGILVMAASREVLREEVPDAYKDVDVVVDICHKAGISKKVAKMRPLGVVKG